MGLGSWDQVRLHGVYFYRYLFDKGSVFRTPRKNALMHHIFTFFLKGFES
jgi:hypothetical protein